MRVLHVIGPLKVGGAQTQLLGLVRAAHGRLWEATVCTTSPGPMTPDFRSLGVPMFELRRLGSPGLLRVRALRRFVAAHEFDVIHANLWQANAYARLAVAGFRRRPAVVISERNVEMRRSAVKRQLDTLLGRWTDLWVANSTAVAEFIRQMHPVAGADDQILTIANAVDKEIFFPVDPPVNEHLRVGSLGRLDPEKGFEVLVDAIRVLHERGVELDVVIGGTGALGAELERRAAGLPLRFLGPILPGAGVAAFLRDLDVFVLPSTFREGRPNVLVEALSCGVPVVATDIPGVGEIVAEGGLLVPPSDPLALAEAIVATGKNGSIRERVRQVAERFPSFDELAASYLAAFKLAMFRRDRAQLA